MFIFVILCLFIVQSVCTVIQTPQGPLLGISTKTHREFRGIPFAQPPVNTLRWQPPRPYGKFKGQYNATYSRPGCPQVCILPELECPKFTSEDCLHIDVFTPSEIALEDGQLRPVMVFIAGGGFFQGAGNVPLYTGQYLANYTNVVVVTIEYRLGALGFLVWKNSTGQAQIRGNYGIMDQQLALKWVQASITAFGGDPNRVTLFGQSAGAMSIGIHLLNKQSQGLFHAAIMESNPLGLPYKTRAVQSKWGSAFAKEMNCKTYACLQALPATTIAAQQQAAFHLDLQNPLAMALLWTPCIDFDIVPVSPIDGFRQGLAAKVPIMIGTVQNEGVLFVHQIFDSINDAEYLAILGGLFGLKAFGMARQYPISSAPHGDVTELTSLFATDYLFQCATRRATRLLMANNPNVYQYRFNVSLSFNKFAWGANYTACGMPGLVCHGEELPLLFNPVSLLAQHGHRFNSGEVGVSSSMQRRWSNFAKSGNPNHPMPVTTNWPTANGGLTELVFQIPSELVASNYNAKHCDYMDTHIW